MSRSPRILDLTLPLRSGMRGVEVESCRTVERDGWNASTLQLYSHAGTHMDAQVHFAAGPGTIDRVPLIRCLGPAWVVSVEPVLPHMLIEPKHLHAVSERFQPGESLLLRTGWSRFVDDPERYRDGLPRLSEAFAKWCVEHRVQLLGVEPPSVADVNHLEEVTRIHRILLGGGVTIVEGLCQLERISEEKVLFGAFPLKVEGGDGAPCRAFALEGVLETWLPLVAVDASEDSPNQRPEITGGQP